MITTRVSTQIRMDEDEALRAYAAGLPAPFTDNLAAAIRSLLRIGMDIEAIGVDMSAPICRRCDKRARVERKDKRHGGRWRAYCKVCESELAAERMRTKYHEAEDFRERTKARAAAWTKANRR